MTPERIEEIREEIRDSYYFVSVKSASELLAALEEAQQQLHRTRITSSVHEGNSDSYFAECERLRGLLAEEQQTIARQREVWKELKEIVSTNATSGRGEDINDYDIMLNIMGDLEGETQP